VPLQIIKHLPTQCLPYWLWARILSDWQKRKGENIIMD